MPLRCPSQLASLFIFFVERTFYLKIWDIYADKVPLLYWQNPQTVKHLYNPPRPHICKSNRILLIKFRNTGWQASQCCILDFLLVQQKKLATGLGLVTNFKNGLPPTLGRGFFSCVSVCLSLAPPTMSFSRAGSGFGSPDILLYPQLQIKVKWQCVSDHLC